MASTQLMSLTGVLKNSAFTLRYCLEETADSEAFKANPTIAAGDAQISKDGGAFANVATLPSAEPAGGAAVKQPLSADEMNADVIVYKMVDQTASQEWGGLTIVIYTTGVMPLVRSATPANALAVDSSGRIDVGSWLGTAVTTSTSNLPKVDVDSIDGNTDAATNLENFTDSTTTPTSYLPVNVAQISGDGTAADNLESYTDGTDNIQVHLVELTSSMDFSTTMKTSIETAVNNKLNAAIPGSPTANSIYERIAAIDDLTQAGGNGDLAAILVDTGTSGCKIDLTQPLSFSPTASTVGEVLASEWSSIRGKVARSGTTVTYYKDDDVTALFTRTLDSASNPTSITGS